MDTIKVDKAELIAKLKTNRDEHREIFLKAQDVYRERWIGLLEERLRQAREGDPIEQAFRLPVPEDHTTDFNTAIQMLEWDQGKTVKLSMAEFRMYVENEWGWARSFAANTQAYVAQ